MIGLLVAMQHSVLVVDDDGDVCEMLSELLSEAGYDVRCAHNGEEAWAVVQRDPPDLILSDIRMPKLDGIDLASRLIFGGVPHPHHPDERKPCGSGGRECRVHPQAVCVPSSAGGYRSGARYPDCPAG